MMVRLMQRRVCLKVEDAANQNGREDQENTQGPNQQPVGVLFSPDQTAIGRNASRGIDKALI